MPKELKRTVLALLILVLLPVVHFLAGPYIDRRAIRQATEFCSSVSLGEAFSTLSTRAEKNGVALEKWSPRQGGDERYIAQFQGFLANSVLCEISVVNKKVDAKFVEEEFW